MATLANPPRERRGRRGNGEGSITFDKSKGLWYGRLSVDGSARKTTGTRTREEAVGLLGDLLHQVRHGQAPPSTHHTIAELGTRWLEEIVKRNNDPATYQSYESNWRVHVLPQFGRQRLNKVDRLAVQKWVNAKLDTGLSPRTVRAMTTVLSMAYNQGQDWGWCLHNPASRIKIKGAKSTKEITGVTEADVDQLLTAAEGRSMQNLLTVGLWTGMRKGELGGLRWQDVDFKGGRIHVRQTLVWRSGTPWYFKDGAKTRAGRRSFALLPVVAEALTEQARRVAELRENALEMWTEYDLVFPSEVGTPIHPDNISREQAKLERIAGVDHQRVHDWRHTAATKMRAAGVDDRLVMEVLGWSDRTMLDRYQHVEDGHLDEVVDLMVARYPQAAGTGLAQLPTRSKFAGRPHSRLKGARLDEASGAK